MESPQPIIDSATVPIISNVVATVSLEVRLNLRHLAQSLRNAVYDPRRHPPVVVRMRQPKSTALIQANGSMVITGAESEADAKLAARKHARKVQWLGYEVKFKNFRIQNIVGSAKFGKKNEGLRLAEIKKDHFPHVTYEPETFPMLAYRLLDPKVTCIISTNGKIIVNGAKTALDMHRGWNKILPIVRPYVLQFTEPSQAAATPELDVGEIEDPLAA